MILWRPKSVLLLSNLTVNCHRFYLPLKEETQMRIISSLWRIGSVIVIVAALVTGCETTTVTTSVGFVEIIPEVGRLAELERISKEDAEKISNTLEVRYKRGVYEETILPVYWRDDLKSDLVILMPTAGGGAQMLKVDVRGTRNYFETKGETNGKPFSQKGLAPRNSQ
jgi:hypothetical protein